MQARANFFEIKIIAAIRIKVQILSISSEIFNSKYLICYRAKNVIVCNSVIYEPLLLNFCDKA